MTSGFIRAMVAATAAQNRVDPRRIYATGQSCGGAMTHRLRCEATDLFAAAAPFSWDVPLISCSPPRAMPIQTTRSYDDVYVFYPPGHHIKDDPNLPIMPGALSGFEEWRTRNGCSGASPDVTEHPGSTSVCERYTSCRDGAEVGLCSVHTDPTTIYLGHYAYRPVRTRRIQHHAGRLGLSLALHASPGRRRRRGTRCAGTTVRRLANTDQADAESDSVGDACDNCVNVANPRVAADFLTTNPWATLTGGQRDDDHDGYGNKCDAKFPGVAGSSVSGDDLNQFRASNGKPRSDGSCGTTATRPCAIFDLDETANSISGNDLTRFRLAERPAAGTEVPELPARVQRRQPRGAVRESKGLAPTQKGVGCAGR